MDLRVLPYDHPDAVELIESLQQEYVVRYGGVDQTPVDPDEFAPPNGRFVIGYLDRVPVCCGGWRALDGEQGTAELKRMYVAPAARGRGLSRALLAEMERTITAAGYRRIVLESGTGQPEALGLYGSSGYTPIQPYGLHRCSPNSRCFGKTLAGVVDRPGAVERHG